MQVMTVSLFHIWKEGQLNIYEAFLITPNLLCSDTCGTK